MRRPEGPVLDIAFYHPEWNEADAFNSFVEFLFLRGALFLGEVSFFSNLQARKAYFSMIWDFPINEQSVSQEDLKALLVDPDIKVLEVAFRLKEFGKITTLATYFHVTPKASSRDTHSLGLAMHAKPFELPGTNAHQYRFGKAVYKLFLEAVDHMQPAYAAILIETTLECLTDLRADPRSYAFQNFFIDADFVGPKTLKRLLPTFKEAFIQETQRGYYISTDSAFNPECKQIPSARIVELSVEVCAALCELPRKGREPV